MWREHTSHLSHSSLLLSCISDLTVIEFLSRDPGGTNMHPLRCHSHADISPGVKLPDGFAGQDEGSGRKCTFASAHGKWRLLTVLHLYSGRGRVERKVIRLEFGVHLRQHVKGVEALGLDLLNFASKQFGGMLSMLSGNKFSFKDLICIGIKSAPKKCSSIQRRMSQMNIFETAVDLRCPLSKRDC